MDAAEYLRDANGSTLSLVALTSTWCYSPSVGLLHEAQQFIVLADSAATLKLDVPPTLFARADDVIE